MPQFASQNQLYGQRYQPESDARRLEIERELESLQHKLRMRSAFANPSWFEPPWSSNQTAPELQYPASSSSANSALGTQIQDNRQPRERSVSPIYVGPDEDVLGSPLPQDSETPFPKERSMISNVGLPSQQDRDDEREATRAELSSSRLSRPDSKADTASSFGSRPASVASYERVWTPATSSRGNSADVRSKKRESISPSKYRLYERDNGTSNYGATPDMYTYDNQLDEFIFQWNKSTHAAPHEGHVRVSASSARPVSGESRRADRSPKRQRPSAAPPTKMKCPSLGYPSFTAFATYDFSFKDANGLSPGAPGFLPPMVGRAAGYAGRAPTQVPRPLAPNGYDENYTDQTGRRAGDKGFVPPTLFVTAENDRIRKEAGLFLGFDKDYHDAHGRRFGDVGFVPPAYTDSFADKAGRHVGEEGFVPPPHGEKGTYGGTKPVMGDALHYGQYDCNYMDRWGRKPGQLGFVPPLVATAGGHPALACLNLPLGYDDFYVDPTGRRPKDPEFLAPAPFDDGALAAQLEQLAADDVETWASRMGARCAAEAEAEADWRRIEHKLLVTYAENTPVKRYMREQEAENRRVAELGKKIKEAEDARLRKEQELLEQMQLSMTKERILEEEMAALTRLQESHALLQAQLEAERVRQQRRREAAKAAAAQASRNHTEVERIARELQQSEERLKEENASLQLRVREAEEAEARRRANAEEESQKQEALRAAEESAKRERERLEAERAKQAELEAERAKQAELEAERKRSEDESKEHKRKAPPPLVAEDPEIERIRAEAMEKEKTRVKTQDEEDANKVLKDLQEQLEKNPPTDPEELRKLRLKVRDSKMAAARAAMKGGAGSIPASPSSNSPPSAAPPTFSNKNLRREKRELYFEKLSPKLAAFDRLLRDAAAAKEDVELAYDNGEQKLCHDNCTLCGCPFGATENGISIAGQHLHDDCCICFDCRGPLEMTCARADAFPELLFHEDCVQKKLARYKNEG